MARRTSLAASSRASTEACSLYQDVCGVQIRLGASFRGPVEKLWRREKDVTETSNEVFCHSQLFVLLVYQDHLKGSVSWTSRAAPRIRPSFRAWANAFSSTRPPLDVFTRKAPWRICIRVSNNMIKLWGADHSREGCNDLALLYSNLYSRLTYNTGAMVQAKLSRLSKQLCSTSVSQIFKSGFLSCL